MSGDDDFYSPDGMNGMMIGDAICETFGGAAVRSFSLHVDAENMVHAQLDIILTPAQLHKLTSLIAAKIVANRLVGE